MQAGFTAVPRSGVAPLQVRFGDASNQWLWDFSDDTTSALQNPNHTYNDAGFYTATLTTTGTRKSDSLAKAAVGYLLVSR